MMYGVKHIETHVVTEKGVPEPMYIFSDKIGGFTLEGIMNSLQPVLPELPLRSMTAEQEVKHRTEEIDDLFYGILNNLDKKFL